MKYHIQAMGLASLEIQDLNLSVQKDAQNE
jgi:hypothetical protein